VGNYVTQHSAEGNSEYIIADPIASILFGVITLFTTLSLIARILNVLLEQVPQGISYEQVKGELQKIRSVMEVNDLHIWSLTVGKNYLSCHIEVDGSRSHDEILRDARLLCSRHDITHTTIQIDPFGSTSCISHC